MKNSQPPLLRRKSSALAALPVEDGIALTVLEAPFGYGKSTLIRQWMEDLPTTIPVFEVDVEDERWRERLEQWALSLDTPALAVIDDYHTVSTVFTDRALVRILQSNANSHLVVSGRRSALLDTPTVTSRVDTRILKAKDLAFDASEVAAWVENVGFEEGKENGGLLRAVNGWPIFVNETTSHDFEIARGKSLLRSLVSSLSASSNTRQVARLLMLSGGMSTAVIGEVTRLPEEDVQAGLEGLVESGLVRMGWRSGVPHYAPHALLFAVFGAEKDSEEEETNIDLAVALQAEEDAQEDPVGSLRKVLEYGLFDTAQELAQAHLLRLLGCSDEVWPLVRDVSLPDQLKAPALGGLRFFIAYADQRVDWETLRSWAEELKVVALEIRDETGEALIDSSLLGLAADRVLGDWTSAVESALTLEEELLKSPRRIGSGKWSFVPLIYEAMMFTGLLGGDLDLAERAALHGLTIARAEDSPVTVDTLSALALISAIRGHTDVAKGYLGEADREKHRFGLQQSKNSMATASVARATVLLSEGKLDEAAEELELPEQDVVRIDAWEQFATVEARVNRYRYGNRDALLTLRRRITDAGVNRMSHSSASRMTAEVANLLIYQGELVPARQLLGLPLTSTPALSLARARLALVSGEHAEALTLAEPAKGLGDWSENSVANFLVAIAFDADGDRSGAIRELKDSNLNLPKSRLRLVLSELPYEPLHEISRAYAVEDESRLLRLVEGLADFCKFKGTVPLTGAELKTLTAIAECRTTKEAAERLGLSVNTVKSHLSSIYRKLGVSTRKDMVQAAEARGLQ